MAYCNNMAAVLSIQYSYFSAPRKILKSSMSLVLSLVLPTNHTMLGLVHSPVLIPSPNLMPFVVLLFYCSHHLSSRWYWCSSCILGWLHLISSPNKVIHIVFLPPCRNHRSMLGLSLADVPSTITFNIYTVLLLNHSIPFQRIAIGC